MVLKQKCEADARLIPDGIYSAVLSRVYPFENSYGPRVGFEFTLAGNGIEGAKVVKSTSPNLSVKGKLAEVITGLVGRELTDDELSNGVDTERLVGSKCSVLVLKAKTKAGTAYSAVERIFQAGA